MSNQFFKPCLLLMLVRCEAHGYNLRDELTEFGFNPDRVDPSLIYQALRWMEDWRWVTSQSDDESQGPKRSVYNILPEGETILAKWVADLRRTRDEIVRLVSAYEREFEPVS